MKNQAQAARDLENSKLRKELQEALDQLHEKDKMLTLFEEQMRVLKEEIRKAERQSKRASVDVEYVLYLLSNHNNYSQQHLHTGT